MFTYPTTMKTAKACAMHQLVRAICFHRSVQWTDMAGRGKGN